jgi:hypothetical protein
MNAASFNHLIYSPADTGISFSDLEAAVQAYPWCQPLRVALAVRAYAEGNSEKEEFLGQAAVHTFHRARLRVLLEPHLKGGMIRGPESLRKRSPMVEAKPEAEATPDVVPIPEPGKAKQKPSLVKETLDSEDQNKLIDDFLASQEGIRLSRKDIPEQPTTDLAAKSVSFDGLIISETMARMYMRQGQPEKAAYIVSQLSLKNPDKSAYFAEILKSGGPEA